MLRGEGKGKKKRKEKKKNININFLSIKALFSPQFFSHFTLAFDVSEQRLLILAINLTHSF